MHRICIRTTTIEIYVPLSHESMCLLFCTLLNLNNKLSISLCTRFYIFSSHSTETKEEAAGSNTAVTVVVVIVIICLLGAASVFLALKYMAKSPEVTPVMEEKKSGSQGETKRKRRKKLKHSSSTTGVGEGPGVSKTPEAQGGEKKKRRRKRSRVGGQNQNQKGRQQTPKQGSA